MEIGNCVRVMKEEVGVIIGAASGRYLKGKEPTS